MCVCIYVTFPNTLFFCVCVWMCMWIKACLMSVTQKQMFCSGHDTMSFYSMKWASSLHCWSCSAWRLSECALHRLCVWVCAHILKVQRVMFKPVFNPETTFFFFFKISYAWCHEIHLYVSSFIFTFFCTRNRLHVQVCPIFSKGNIMVSTQLGLFFGECFGCNSNSGLKITLGQFLLIFIPSSISFSSLFLL